MTDQDLNDIGVLSWVFVTAGSLHDPAIFVPLTVVYVTSVQPWDRIDPALKRFDRMPPLPPRLA